MILYGLFINVIYNILYSKIEIYLDIYINKYFDIKEEKGGAIKKTLTESWLEFFIAFDSTKFTASNE
jgi:hypothetical protein